VIALRLGKILVRRLKLGYRRASASQRVSRPVYRAPQAEFPTGEFGVTGEVEARISEQPVEVTARQSLPTRLESPLEMTLRPARPETVTGGVEIPILSKRIKFDKLRVEEEKPLTTIIYPLIPSKPTKGEPIYAYAKISWDQKTSRYIYQIIEPKLTPKLSDVLDKIKELLEQKLDIDFSKLKMIEASEYLKRQIEDLINYFRFRITPTESLILKYYIERDFMGLGKIEPLMRDKNIEDISCDGIGIPIFIYHRNPQLGSIITNISFDNEDELDSFITRLVQLSGKSISVSQPLIDGSLPDGSRLQATLATDIARRGSNFTIRLFSEEPLTPTHLLNYGTVDVKTLAYLWLAVDFGRSILVSGGTASGKTSLLNVISLFIRPEKKIISIEDTAELKLPHSHWVPTVARTPISMEEGKGEVDMFSLLKESLRQRPDYIIVGEVRGKEAYILFQQIATGHPSLATIHAENMGKLVDRLTTEPLSLPKPLIGSLDIVVFILRARHKNKFVRKISEVLEMIRFDAEASGPVVNQVFKWNPVADVFEISNKSILLQKISEVTGLKPQDLIDEFERRSLVLEWLQAHNITDYRSVHKAIDMYYAYPKRVLAAIMGER